MQSSKTKSSLLAALAVATIIADTHIAQAEMPTEFMDKDGNIINIADGWKVKVKLVNGTKVTWPKVSINLTRAEIAAEKTPDSDLLSAQTEREQVYYRAYGQVIRASDNSLHVFNDDLTLRPAQLLAKENENNPDEAPVYEDCLLFTAKLAVGMNGNVTRLIARPTASEENTAVILKALSPQGSQGQNQQGNGQGQNGQGRNNRGFRSIDFNFLSGLDSRAVGPIMLFMKTFDTGGNPQPGANAEVVKAFQDDPEATKAIATIVGCLPYDSNVTNRIDAGGSDTKALDQALNEAVTGGITTF